jgi:hypothetical protein
LLPEKASVFIIIDNFEDFLQAPDLRRRIVAVPPKIGSLPIDLPHAFGLDVGSLRDSFFDFSFGVISQGQNFEYLDALASDPTIQIDLLAKV